MKLKQLACVVALALFALASTAGAQALYPMREKADSPCALCPDPMTGRMTAGWGNPDTTAPASAWPLKGFIGRWCDSSYTRDHQATLRTARAFDVKFSPDGKRVYIKLGNAVAAYSTASFFSRQESREPLTSALTAPMTSPNYRFGPAEYYLMWDRFFHADYTASGWITPLTDGQDRLIDFDVDDQGRIYMAYSKFGWGIVYDDGGAGGYTLMPSLMQDITIGDYWGLPTKVFSVKGTSGYYVLLQSPGTPTTKVFKIVNPGAPTELQPLQMNPFAFAKSADRIALVTEDQKTVMIYDIDDFVTGTRPPLVTQTAANGGIWGALTSDGPNFYAVSSEPSNNYGTVATFAANSPVRASSYTRTDVAMNEVFMAGGGKSYGGMVAFVGQTSRSREARVYKIAGSTLVPFPMRDSLTRYYGPVPAGYAYPSYGSVLVATPWKQANRSYLIISAYGLGDTYELNDVDALDITAGTATTGGSSSYFYGDTVALKANSANPNQQQPLTWNFNSPNPADNGDTAGFTNVAKYHRYFGLGTDQIPRVLSVRATLNDNSATAQTSVTLKKPQARFKYALRNATSVQYLVAQPNATAAPILLYGDTFSDDSDGEESGHFLEWAIGAFGDTSQTVSRFFTTNAQTQPVGDCGARTLSFTAHYGPFTTPLSATSISNPDFGIAPDATSDGSTKFSYTVKAVVGRLTYSATTTTLTFTSSSYAASALSGANFAYKWELIGPSGTTVYTGPNSIDGTDLPVAGVANIPAWSFNTQNGSVDLSGYTARLTVRSTGTIAGCASEDSVSIGKPVNAALSGSCVSGCQFAVSGTNNEPTDGHWTYTWTAKNADTGAAVNVTAAPNGTTFAPTFTQTGNYYVTVTVANEFGSVTRQSLTYTVQGTSSCPLFPGNNIFLNEPSCANGNCAFSVGFWPAAPSCPITYAWSIDGTQIAGTDSSTSYSTASLAAGSHTVTCVATVTGAAGVTIGSKTFTVGSTTSCPLTPGNNIFLNEPNCANGNCTFSVGFWPAAPSCAIAYAWSVDGSSVAGSGSSITYNSGSLAQGQHTVSCLATVSGTTNAVSLGSKTFTVGTTNTGCPLTPGSNIFLNQPACADGNCSFSVGFWPAAPACSISYTWRVDGSAISGNASSVSYGTAGLAQGQHTVSCIATPSGGSGVDLGSKTFTVGPQSCPALVAGTNVILNEPTCYQGNCSFTVTAPAVCSLAYSWQIDGATVAGATGATYSTSTLSAGQHNVSVTVTGATTLTLGPRTFTVIPPANACTLASGMNIFLDNEVCTPDGCSFSVSTFGLAGSCALTYSWTMDGKVVDRATASKMVYALFLPKGSHTVTCAVKSGESTAQLQRTFTLNSTIGAGVLPEVDIAFSPLAIVGTPVDFVPIVGPAEFVPQKYTWTVTGPTGSVIGPPEVRTAKTAFLYTFPSNGRYTVSLTVDGATSSGTKSVSVDVAAPARRRTSRR